MLRWLLTRGIYPLVFFGGLAAGIVAVHGRGFDVTIVTAVLTTAGAALVTALERMLPFRADWNRSRGDFSSDCVHGLFSFLLLPEFTRLCMLLIPPLFLSASAARVFGAEGAGVWPMHWPLLAQLLLAVLLAEFTQYWTHRIAHERSLFWRFHAVHHGADRIYWLNTGREHPLSFLWMYLVPMLALVLVGCPESIRALFILALGLNGPLQHSNIDLRLGPLNYVMSAPEAHRWHHSTDSREADTNYGALLLVWDHVFGTFYLPDREVRAVGIEGEEDFPVEYTRQFLRPFRKDPG